MHKIKENKLARVDWEDRQMTKWQERGALEGPWLDSAAPALLPTPQSRQEPLTERLFCRAQAWKIMSIFRDLGFRPGSRYDCYVTPNVVLWLCYRSEDPHHPEKHGGPLCPGSSGRHAWHAWRDHSSKGPTCAVNSANPGERHCLCRKHLWKNHDPTFGAREQARSRSRRC